MRRLMNQLDGLPFDGQVRIKEYTVRLLPLGKRTFTWADIKNDAIQYLCDFFGWKVGDVEIRYDNG